MVRRALVLALLAACGTTNDDRPRTIGYITEAILAPTCGGAECHSTFTQNRGDIFDTVSGSRATLVHNLLSFDSPQFDPANPDNSLLIIWITQTDPLGLGIGRMPYDAPMPNADVNLLKEYIRERALGAQCDPANQYSCNNTVLSTCNKDWNFQDQVIDCTVGGGGSGCAGGQCLCDPDHAECDTNPADGCETTIHTNSHCSGCGSACTGTQTCMQGSGGGPYSCM